MYANDRRRSTLRGWGDRPAGTVVTTDPETGERVVITDDSVRMQHCVLVDPTILPGSRQHDPNCPAGFVLQETRAGDFQPGGRLDPEGDAVVANLGEWEVGPDGWLIYRGEFDPDAVDQEPVRLGLEYDTTPRPGQAALAALGLGAVLLLSRMR